MKHCVYQGGVLSSMVFSIQLSKVPLKMNITSQADDSILNKYHPQVELLGDNKSLPKYF